jgi:SNW domain-containing protein 1
MEQGGVVTPVVAADSGVPANNESDAISDGAESIPHETDDEVAARQRVQLCLELRKERERELRIESKQELKKNSGPRQRGMIPKNCSSLSGEVDSRLYNQSADMDSGFGAENEYNTYPKPLFHRQRVTLSFVHRPM